MSLSNSGWFEPLRSVDYTVITDTFKVLGSKFSYPINYMDITNLTDKVIEIGIANPASTAIQIKTLAYNATWVFDISSNKTNGKEGSLSKGTQLYLRYRGLVAPTTGTVDVTTFYTID